MSYNALDTKVGLLHRAGCTQPEPRETTLSSNQFEDTCAWEKTPWPPVPNVEM
jgi:hypothetical protein